MAAPAGEPSGRPTAHDRPQTCGRPSSAPPPPPWTWAARPARHHPAHLTNVQAGTPTVPRQPGRAHLGGRDAQHRPSAAAQPMAQSGSQKQFRSLKCGPPCEARVHILLIIGCGSHTEMRPGICCKYEPRWYKRWHLHVRVAHRCPEAAEKRHGRPDHHGALPKHCSAGCICPGCGTNATPPLRRRDSRMRSSARQTCFTDRQWRQATDKHV